MAPLNLVDCLSVKISLLGLINGLPENPSANELPKTLQSKEPRPGRILPPGHEISITQQLAFLSGYSNESSHVLAVCVEEASSGDSLIIRLAANTGKHEQFLDRLRMISHVLENEASDGVPSHVQQDNAELTNRV